MAASGTVKGCLQQLFLRKTLEQKRHHSYQKQLKQIQKALFFGTVM